VPRVCQKCINLNSRRAATALAGRALGSAVFWAVLKYADASRAGSAEASGIVAWLQLLGVLLHRHSKGQRLIAGHAEMVDLLRVPLYLRHELVLVGRLDRPAAVAANSLHHRRRAGYARRLTTGSSRSRPRR
jgi:hypothetical protein